MPVLNPYLESKVTTSPSYELHLLVIDGAILFSRQATEALEARDYEKAHLSLNRSREFVTELIAGLDADQATEVVNNLKRLFAYVYGNLARGDMDHDPQRVRDAIRVLEMHRTTWLQLIENLKAERQTLGATHSETNETEVPADDYEGTGRSWTA